MILFVSKDLEYVGYENRTSLRKVGRDKKYAVIRFVDKQTKREVAVYDWSGIESAALTFSHFHEKYAGNVQWYIDGYVNVNSSSNYLVLRRFGFVEGDETINPYTMEKGLAEVES
jgi:hypothetical protein